MNSCVVIFNRNALQSAKGWIHIVPKGELPNREAGIVQVLDDESLASIFAGIEKDKNRLGDKWPGIYAGREHFIYNSEQDSEALAWFKDFEIRGDGIWAKDDGMTDIGTDALKNRRYKFTSFVADRSDLKKIEGNRYRVMRIETVGFTNQANGKELLTPITNRQGAAVPCPDCGTPMKPMAGDKMFCPDCGKTLADAGASAANQKQATKNKMKNIATKLGLAAEASEDAILAEVTKLTNRGDISSADLVTLRAEHKTRGEQNQTLLGEQVDGLLAEHGIKDEKVMNRLKPVLSGLKDRAERLETLADFGFKPVAPGKTTPAARVLNRGAGGAAAQTETTDEATALVVEQERATKVMNRAKEISKETPTISLATATTMAAKEIK